MIHASMLPRVKKRPRPVEASARGQEEVKFNEVTVYLVERKMGSSRRSFLTSLARSKGFRVEYVLSDEVTHVVAEDNQAGALWAWLRGSGLRDVSRLQVLDISWFTDSMREGRPVTVETRHCIPVREPVVSLSVGGHFPLCVCVCVCVCLSVFECVYMCVCNREIILENKLNTV
uniref:BRCT domain-containing protein n=1 Tax=Hucho hucho TaxID=62062 RepID=A0A4W5RJB5_9TELE